MLAPARAADADVDADAGLASISRDGAYREIDKVPVVYLMRCLHPRRKLTYIGSTPDASRRWRQHNSEIAGGARYTTRQSSEGYMWTPMAVVVCPSLAIARSLESRTKKTPFRGLARTRWDSAKWHTRSGQRLHRAVRKLLKGCWSLTHAPSGVKGSPKLRLLWFEDKWAPQLTSCNAHAPDIVSVRTVDAAHCASQVK